MNAPAKKLQRVNATAQFEAGRRLRWDVTWLHIPKNAGTELESVALRGGLRWGRHVAWMAVSAADRLRPQLGPCGHLPRDGPRL